MTHSCDDCGRTFETLTRLRLHDCPNTVAADADNGLDPEWEAEVDQHLETIRRQEHAEEQAARQAASPQLTDALDRAEAGDPDAAHRLLAYYERHLSDEWVAEDGGCYDGFHRLFYEPATTALEDLVLTEGWPFLLEILEAYWPSIALALDAYAEPDAPEYPNLNDYEDYPHVSHVLTNVTGRYVIRTRRTDDVTAIPPEALEYLFLFHRHPGDRGAWLESMIYGWGIGHPEHPVTENVHALVDGNYDIWAGAALEHALHADQHAAKILFEDIFEAGVVSDPATVLRGLSYVDHGRYPSEPKYWDWERVYPEFAADGFVWDPEVRECLRTLVEDAGVDQDLPDNWTFADIEI